jgi:hypothetical protein
VKPSKAKLAKQIDARVRNWRPSQRAGWIGLGEDCLLAKSNQLYTSLGFASFDEWVEDALSASRSLAYEAMAVIKAFSKLPKEQMAQIPKENLKLLAKLPEKKRYNVALLAKAAELTGKELRVLLNNQHGAHLPTPATLRYPGVPTDALASIDKAIKAAKLFGEAELHPLEVLAINFLQAPCEEEEYRGMSVEEAYEEEVEA